MWRRGLRARPICHRNIIEAGPTIVLTQVPCGQPAQPDCETAQYDMRAPACDAVGEMQAVPQVRAGLITLNLFSALSSLRILLDIALRHEFPSCAQRRNLGVAPVWPESWE